MWKKTPEDKKTKPKKPKNKSITQKKKKKICSQKIHESFVDQWIEKNVTSVSWWYMYVSYDITGK